MVGQRCYRAAPVPGYNPYRPRWGYHSAQASTQKQAARWLKWWPNLRWLGRRRQQFTMHFSAISPDICGGRRV